MWALSWARIVLLIWVLVSSRTIKDDINHLYSKNGRIITGVITGDLAEIRLGLNEGGSSDCFLEPFFGEMMLGLGKAHYDFPSCPAIHLAYNLGTKQHVNVVAFLLSMGVNPNIHSIPTVSSPLERGFPPAPLFALGLGQDAQNFHAALLQRLIRTSPAAVNITALQNWQKVSGNPPLLQFCLLVKNLDGVSVLLQETNIDVNEKDSRGVTALHVSTWMGSPTAMIMLLQHGANPLQRDVWGRTPFHYLAMRRHPASLAALLLEGVRIWRTKSQSKLSEDELVRKVWDEPDETGVSLTQFLRQRPFVSDRWSQLRQRSLGDSPSSEIVTEEECRDISTRTEIDHGGWSTNVFDVHLPTGSCHMTISRIDSNSDSIRIFQTQYFSAQRPVVFATGLFSGSNIWSHWMKSEFIERFGDINVATVAVTGPSATRSPTLVTLSRFVDHCMDGAKSDGFSLDCSLIAIVFADFLPAQLLVQIPHEFQLCSANRSVESNATSDVHLASASDEPLRLHIGQAGARSQFMRVEELRAHVNDHGGGGGERTFYLQEHIFRSSNASWFLLLSGEQHWLLLPPSVSTDVFQSASLVTPADLTKFVAYLRGNVSELLVEVALQMGETLFVPHDWNYIMINKRASVSISQEFCTFLNTDLRIQPLGPVVYGGPDHMRGLGQYKTHLRSNYKMKYKRPEKTTPFPIFDFPGIN